MRELGFGLEPVFDVVAMNAAASEVQSVGAHRDLLVRRRKNARSARHRSRAPYLTHLASCRDLHRLPPRVFHGEVYTSHGDSGANNFPVTIKRVTLRGHV